MTSMSIIPRFGHLKQVGQHHFLALRRTPRPEERPTLRYWADHPSRLPRFVQQSPVAARYLQLLGPLAWDQLPEREVYPLWVPQPVSYAAFVTACLVKLDQQLVSMGSLRQYLVERPELVWLFNFPLVASDDFPWGFDANASLPTQRHFTRMLRTVPSPLLQFLLDSSVTLVQAELAEQGIRLGECISMDTKHILAWVKENNPKAYLKSSQRFDKTRQPKGDPNCRLGCKRRHNQQVSSKETPSTPANNPVPANTISVGEYYWGYASGIVATKVPGWGEIVLAELTQPFNLSDVAYFFPLMADVERRLGFRPKFAAFDAAFDAFYVYEYFHQPGGEGFAAVPLAERGGNKHRQFSSDGAPICPADLPMALKYTFLNRSGLLEHNCQRYVCPLRFPKPNGRSCPKTHPRWAKGGCTATMAASIGARLRYQIDRDSQAYKEVYRQRTATERINSQAVDLGIERPRLRNGQAIANQNTLTYVLINLRTLQRIRQRKIDQRDQHNPSALAA
jgi:hypothetical protein